MTRFVQFKKNSKYILSNKETGLMFPMEHPVSFVIDSTFYAPIPAIVKHISDVMADGALNQFSAIGDVLDMGAKMFGVTPRPRGFYAQVWQETKPMSFTILIDLKFGWRGLYSGKTEIKEVAEALIDASLPYMKKTDILGISTDIVFAPAPSGADIMIASSKQLMEQLKTSLGPLSALVPDKKNRGEVYKVETSEYRSELVGFKYDPRTNKFFVYMVVDDRGQAHFAPKGYYNIQLDETTGARNTGREGGGGDSDPAFKEYFEKEWAPWKKQTEAKLKTYQKDFDEGRTPETYVTERDVGENQFEVVTNVREYMDRVDISKNETSQSTWSDIFFTTLSKSSKIDDGSPTKNQNNNTKSDTTDSSDTWDVILNGRITIKNLVLNALTYSFGNEQDKDGNPLSVVLNLNFISQNFPVSSFDYSKLNDIDIE